MCFLFAGYLFSGDVIGSMEKYCDDMVHSVMERAEAVYRNFGTNVRNYYCTFVFDFSDSRFHIEISRGRCLNHCLFADER